MAASKVEIKDYPFENLVFEGGGNKGLAYVGAVRVLEKAGALKKVKRYCGASVGAMAAGFLAVGYSADDVEKFLGEDLKSIMFDNSWGYLSLLPNLLSGFGWNPGKRLLSWYEDKLATMCDGNGKVTFRELHQKKGTELCVVVTNLNQMVVEYCHPKTTPEMSVALAVRMSASLPGVFQGVWHRSDRTHEKGEEDDVYVDGGLICNYPIHAFDGWFLSMKSDDTFFKRIPELEKISEMYSSNDHGRFYGKNMKTIGLMLYSKYEIELMRDKLDERAGKDKAVPPKDSKIYKERQKVEEKQKLALEANKEIVEAIRKFMAEIAHLEFDDDQIVNMQELRSIFQNTERFTKKDREVLFGDKTVEEAFHELDVDNNKKVTFKELITFVERRGINLRQKYLGFCRKKVHNVKDFFFAIEEALCINIKRLYVDTTDIDRTIGIDTDYVETKDFDLEAADKKFLVQAGEKGALAFLRFYDQQKSKQ